MHELNKTSVHVWHFTSEVMKAAADKWIDTLTDEEVGRAHRFYRNVDGLKFAGTRIILRQLLGRYLKTGPKSVRLRVSALGKPLVDPGSRESINFSVSRSGDVAIMAFTRTKLVGVDIELIDESILPLECTKKAGGFFGLSPAGVNYATIGTKFYDEWTRKEAYLKALGIGVFHEIAKTVYSVDRKVWLVRPLAIDRAYAAAIAVEKPITTIHCGSIGLSN
jgi:4'-phosphopantetheinyl transferase